MTTEPERPSDFIRDIIAEDLRTGKYKQIITRFPPEPNGYLHIGHGKSICLNFGSHASSAASATSAWTILIRRREETEYVRSIMADVHWLIDGWADKQLGGAPSMRRIISIGFTSMQWELIRKGKAYVDDMSSGKTRTISPSRKASTFATVPSMKVSICLRGMKAGRVSRWRAHVASKD